MPSDTRFPAVADKESSTIGRQPETGTRLPAIQASPRLSAAQIGYARTQLGRRCIEWFNLAAKVTVAARLPPKPWLTWPPLAVVSPWCRTGHRGHRWQFHTDNEEPRHAG
jgi:hypothetical protein